MNINSINFTSQTAKTYKNSDNKNPNDTFSDKLNDAVTDDTGYASLLNEINNEPKDDREEDRKLYEVLKYHGFDCKGHSLQWVKGHCGLVTFPPITVPGHIRTAYNNYINNLPLSTEEKAKISFDLATEYGLYIKNNPNAAISVSYNTDSMKELINHLMNNNENYNNSKDFSSMRIYENTKILLNNFMNILN
ncbi:hypothetical protein [Clostridium felsineum]|uniref:Uncharacterized protein n=1 Tax=Clostridium felsineum TaxID=36839 RepID=A0A1S8MAL3_9CLOT|nr:hypothetical protein [Clostridium felsineum]MCR3761194.1 hypothetical protein [Clostridium felsineum]URZ02336.1 hypothetical protein CLAUR_023330 [Clostridium felsineum]URZ04910.1 hypothetical protein CLROS_002340 [Clostridium felsineum]URZ09951.1 hypothetical protein CROST_006590 [Clostridium felsineum]